MKLDLWAKPVRIRIKSGGEEHSSLDSLRRSFCVDDLKPLISDKRLSRWLKQQNETELAMQLDGFDVDSLNSKQGIIDLLLLFFKDLKESIGTTKMSLNDIAVNWYQRLEYKKNAGYLDLCLLEYGDPMAVKRVLKKKQEH